MKHDLIVIGGGASGITAAITAKDMGSDVAILENTNRIGKKILTTGNGRCNITNENISLKNYHCSQNLFPKNTLDSFGYEDTKNFFSALGLPLATLDGGKVYPLSLQASSVIDIFRFALDDKNIPLYTDAKVKEIIHQKNKFKILTSSGDEYVCNKVVIATGGQSYPKTGSDGSSYKFIKSLGHSITPLLPSLVQLKLNYNKLKAISGVKFDGNAKIFVKNNLERSESGELLFTDYGISGPPILQLSRIASLAKHQNKPVTVVLDMFPQFSLQELKDFLEDHWGVFSYRSIHDSFIGIINKKLIPTLLKESNIDNIHKPCWDLDWKEKNKLYSLLKEWTFEVTGTNSFNNAQVTLGGVNVNDINSTTLESKIVPNLFFCGEILDVDADCGGFNLQWAWSSGFVAGKSASEN